MLVRNSIPSCSVWIHHKKCFVIEHSVIMSSIWYMMFFFAFSSKWIQGWTFPFVLSLQNQRIMSIETELDGYKRQIKKAQEQNEQLTYMQNRIETDIALLKKQIGICQNKHESLKIQYSTYSRTLYETEQQLNRATTVCINTLTKDFYPGPFSPLQRFTGPLIHLLQVSLFIAIPSPTVSPSYHTLPHHSIVLLVFPSLTSLPFPSRFLLISFTTLNAVSLTTIPPTLHPPFLQCLSYLFCP